MSALTPNDGKQQQSKYIVLRWPFCLDRHSFIDGYEYIWRCGWDNEGDEYENYFQADADGWYVLEELSRHKPSPRHMERVFARSQMFNPLGQPFGRPKLKIYTSAKFKNYETGIGYLPVDVERDGIYSEKYSKIAPFVVPHPKLQKALQAVEPSQ